MQEEKVLVELTGVMDVSTELCLDGSEALQLTADDGVDYVINNRRTVRRMLPYAYNNSRLKCKGYVEHDPTGIEVLAVVYFEEIEGEEQVNATKSSGKKKVTKSTASSHKTKLPKMDEPDFDEDALEFVNIDDLDEEDFDSSDN